MTHSGENSKATDPSGDRNGASEAYNGEQYISYQDESYLPTMVHLAGWAGNGVLHLEAFSPQGEEVAKRLPRTYSISTQPVLHERDRVHRAGPLQLLRQLENVISGASSETNLHLLALIPYEIAHVFDDLADDLPLLFEFQFVEMKFLATRTLPWDKAPRRYSLPKLQVLRDTGGDFSKSFQATRENFAAGDIFEIVLSRRIDVGLAPMEHAARSSSLSEVTIESQVAEQGGRQKEDSKNELFCYLGEQTASFGAPHRFALSFPKTKVVGASPELLVRVCQGKTIARPISGSMRRNSLSRDNSNHDSSRDNFSRNKSLELSAEEETQFEKLLESEKEKSELDMLIDLARHDLHRVCENVTVSRYREALVLETVVHTQATVSGQLLPQMTSMDALFSCLNAGTLVGAPKRKAMQIIAQQEQRARGYYGGNLIHIRPGGDLRATILIRTVVMQEVAGRLEAQVQAGATVLLDSNEEYEYWECGAKMQGILQLLGLQKIAFGLGEPPEIVQTSIVPKAQIRHFYAKSYQSNGQGNMLASGQDTVMPSGHAHSLFLSRNKTPLHFLLVDNEDSFTFNLEALFASFGVQLTVLRNRVKMPNLSNYQGLILSPGPSAPQDAGYLLEYVRQAAGKLPVFGVCLGFQAMVDAMGGTLGRLPFPLHGKVRNVKVTGKCAELSGLPQSFAVARYHSLFAAQIPESLQIVATDEDNVPMALRGPKNWPPFFGVQFHPESFLTGEFGVTIVKNWLEQVMLWEALEQV